MTQINKSTLVITLVITRATYSKVVHQQRCHRAKAEPVDYFKVAGVELFLKGYNEGEDPVKLVDCRSYCVLGIFLPRGVFQVLAGSLLGTSLQSFSRCLYQDVQVDFLISLENIKFVELL
jgi:hypothetical protein